MESKRLMEILEDAGYELRSYSGRGMFGDTCVGFIIDASDSLLTVGAELADSVYEIDERASLLRVIRGAKTDSMGLSTIVYFPRMKWEGDE